MEMILSLIICVLVGFMAISQLKKDSPVSTDNIQTTAALNVADNILTYASNVKQYVVDAKISNQVIANSVLDAYKTTGYDYRPLANYSAVVVTESPTAIRYILVTWSNINDKNTIVEHVAGQISRMSNQMRQINSTDWVIPLMIKNNNCNGVIMNSYIRPVYKSLAGYTTLFNNLCNVSQSTLGFSLQQYVLMVQIAD